MTGYEKYREIIRGSKLFSFSGTKLTLSGYRNGNEVVLDFSRMSEEAFEELVMNDAEYEESMKILEGSKQYEFRGENILTVTSYNTGEEVRLNLLSVTERIYEQLAEEELEDSFEDAVNGMEDGEGLSV